MQDVVVEDEPLFAADSKDRRRILTHARVVSDFRNSPCIAARRRTG